MLAAPRTRVHGPGKWQKGEPEAIEELETRFPILQPIDDPGALAQVASGGGSRTAAILGEALEERLRNLDEVEQAISGGDLELMLLPRLVTRTKMAAGIEMRSIEALLIDDHVGELQAEQRIDALLELAVTFVGLGLSLLAFIPSGGSSTAATLLLAGRAGAAVIDVAQALQGLTRYQEQQFLSGALPYTHLDQSEALAAPAAAPAVIGLILDVIPLASVAADAAKVLRVATAFNAVLKAPGASLRLQLDDLVDACRSLDTRNGRVLAGNLVEEALRHRAASAARESIDETVHAAARAAGSPTGRAPASIEGLLHNGRFWDSTLEDLYTGGTSQQNRLSWILQRGNNSRAGQRAEQLMGDAWRTVRRNALAEQRLGARALAGPRRHALQGAVFEQMMNRHIESSLESGSGQHMLPSWMGHDYEFVNVHPRRLAPGQATFISGDRIRDAFNAQLTDGIILANRGGTLVVATAFEAKSGELAAQMLVARFRGRSAPLNELREDILEFLHVFDESRRPTAVEVRNMSREALWDLARQVPSATRSREGQIAGTLERLSEFRTLIIDGEEHVVSASSSTTRMVGVAPANIDVTNSATAISGATSEGARYIDYVPWNLPESSADVQAAVESTLAAEGTLRDIAWWTPRLAGLGARTVQLDEESTSPAEEEERPIEFAGGGL